MSSTTTTDAPKRPGPAAEAPWPGRRARRRRGLPRLLFVVLLGAACAAAMGLVGYALGLRTEAQGLRDDAERRLAGYSGALTSELSRYGYLPSVLALSRTVQSAATHPDDAAAVQVANRFLEAANREADSAALYVMDPHGTTIAASNWGTPGSFVGMNFAFRPYFREAMAGKVGLFYGIGTTSHVPGLYFSRPLRAAGRIVGVVVAKVDLDKVALPWQRGRDPVLVVDANGIVFLTSVPQWRFESLAPLSAATRRRIAQTRQYYAVGSVREIGLAHVGRAAGADLVQLPPSAAMPDWLFGKDSYMVARQPVPGTDWQILSLSDLRPAQEAALWTALASAALTGLLVAVALVVHQRRRVVAERLAAREALERAYGELETRVEARTAALTALNAELQREVDERLRAQSELTRTLEELAQSNKMAALGQMATGIAHELNQPLAALHTLSDNAVVFLDQSRPAEARGNLDAILQLVQRMARITGDLKSFARKAPKSWEPGRISQALAGASSLLQPRLRKEAIALDARFPADEPMVLCDELRLQQVLLNLLVNAADALTDQPDKRIEIRLDVDAAAGPDGRWATLRVADTGAGIPEPLLARLFEPFFTTKPQGVGLGLGLNIVQRILRDVGATIEAVNRDGGGAEFRIRLRVADTGIRT